MEDFTQNGTTYTCSTILSLSLALPLSLSLSLSFSLYLSLSVSLSFSLPTSLFSLSNKACIPSTVLPTTVSLSKPPTAFAIGSIQHVHLLILSVYLE